jgi:hypothetical protein
VVLAVAHASGAVVVQEMGADADAEDGTIASPQPPTSVATRSLASQRCKLAPGGSGSASDHPPGPFLSTVCPHNVA